MNSGVATVTPRWTSAAGAGHRAETVAAMKVETRVATVPPRWTSAAGAGHRAETVAMLVKEPGVMRGAGETRG